MIELGTTLLNSEANVISAGNKVRFVCQELAYRQTDIDNLMSVTSDLCRRIRDESEHAEIRIGISETSVASFLTLVFRTDADVLDADRASSFFDDLRLEETGTGEVEMTLMKVVESDCFQSTPEFVRNSRDRLAQISRTELLVEVQRRNEELESRIGELKARAVKEKELATKSAVAESERAGTWELSKAYEELEQAHQREQELATKDVVTRLPNRLFFRDRLAQAINYAERYGQMIAVLFIDIDHFKTVNDTLGHSAGDELLRIIATRLEKCVRKSDTVARLGGDEFTVVLLNVAQAEITVRIADRILDYVSQPFLISGREFFLSASIGIAIYPDDGNDVELLVRNADTAMYEVKNAGRNGYHFYTEEMSTRAIARMELENDLRKAIRENQFELHYQAKVDTFSGDIVAAEALLRWRHPEKGLVMPDEFIPLAEEAGIIVEMGEWVLSTACRQARSWQQLGHPPMPIAVNLSMRQFEQGNLVETIMQTLVASNLDTQWLEIELTEGAILQNAGYARSVLERLRELGVRIAIDDFGTGYSSLSQLRYLPIDSLKIDRSFILGTPANPDDAIVVEAIVGLGRKLDLTLVAEGVETVEQLNFLRDLGCHQCQGFLFSKPLPASGFEAFMEEYRFRVERERA